MKDSPSGRREFLAGTTGAAVGAWLTTHASLIQAAATAAASSMDSGADWAHLTPDEALNLAAVADQVFPPDETPGASQLGAVHFMDAALGGFLAGLLPLIRQGTADLDDRTPAGHFHELEFDQQTAIIRQIESSGFFTTVHFFTLVSLFALPSYGGNKNGDAWKLIGFEPRHVWQPPFGYYDAEYAKENANASA